MKKILSYIVCMCMAVSYAAAQDCLSFFPASEGALLISKTYNSDHNLLNTMIYRVDTSYDYINGSDMLVGLTITDNYNKVISRENVDASCVDGNFYMKMGNRSMSPELIDMLGKNCELAGVFLDYPNTFTFAHPSQRACQIEAGEYTLKARTTGDELKVRIYDRVCEQNEKVETPAGTFEASKLTFLIDCTQDGVTNTHKCIEWYSPGAGIVRTETYDANGNLENYSVLTDLRAN